MQSYSIYIFLFPGLSIDGNYFTNKTVKSRIVSAPILKCAVDFF